MSRGMTMTGARAGFFSSRWHGQTPLSTLLWRDMVFAGTLLNMVAGVVALLLAAQGLPLAWAALLHLSPLPYCVFLFAALWRLPELVLAHRVIALMWLATMVVI